MPNDAQPFTTTHEYRFRAILLYHHAIHHALGRHKQGQTPFDARHQLPSIVRAFDSLEYFAMPQKARQTKEWSSDFSFAQIRLTEQQVDSFHNWLTELKPDFFETATRMALAGYKFSLSADLENDCFIASYTQRGAGHIHNTVTVSSRSNDWEEAFWLSVYKLTVLFPDKPLPTEQRKNNWG